MNLIGHIPGVGPTAPFNPGATTPAPFNVPQTGATDGTGPASATKNMAEIYNRDLLWRRALIATAGLAFDPDNWVQEVAAFEALIAAGVFATQPQFDNSTKAATTAFANRIGVQSSGITVVTTTSAQTAAQAGGTVMLNSGSATVQTVPLANSVRAGSRIHYENVNTGVGNVQRAGGDVFQVNSSTITSAALGNGSTMTLESDGVSVWYVVGGTVQHQYSGEYAFVSTLSGYNRLPGGNILQFGTVGCSAGVDSNVTLPLTFPTAFSNVLVSADYTPSSGVIYKVAGGIINTSTFAIRHDAPGVINVHYWARGR